MWVKYFLIEENWCSGFPDALVGLDNESKEKELLAFLKKHEIDYGYKCDQTIPSFINNGISWYCHEKSAKKVQKKFNITEVHTDKQQLKDKLVKEKDLKKEMKTEEWLTKKLVSDCHRLFPRSLKRQKFVREIKEINAPDIAQGRITKLMVKFFDDNWLTADASGIIQKGSNLPIDES